MLAPNKSEGLPSRTAPSLAPSPNPSSLRAPSTSAFSFAVSPFNFELSPFNPLVPESPHQVHSVGLAFPLFSYSYALFCTAQSANPFAFNALRTLYAKHPGWGTPPFNPITSSFFHTAHASDSPCRPQLQSLHAIAHAFRHTRGVGHSAFKPSASVRVLGQIFTSLFHYLTTSSSVPHGTKPPPARLHRCGGDVHA